MKKYKPLLYIARFFGWLFSWASLSLLAAIGFIAMILAHYKQGIPDVEQLRVYEPATVSRVYSDDGVILDEFARETRLFTPIDEIPDIVKEAFISAEDKNFYTHPGFDLRAIAGALRDTANSFLSEDASGPGPRGASTIPQQVAKNFLLSGEETIERKLEELVISMELVNRLDRDHILSLYLNEIFLGQNSYGVTAAARKYFNKTLEELSPEEAAYLASAPKAPSDIHPVKQYDKAIARRNFVLEEMYENGYISKDEFERAAATELRSVQRGDYPSYRSQALRRGYFTDEIRRQLSEDFGEETLFSEGLSVRATIDQHLQDEAQSALQDALIKYDRGLGRFNGAVATLDAVDIIDDWESALAGARVPRDIENWAPAVVVGFDGEDAIVGIEDVGEKTIPFSSMSWAYYNNADGRRTAPQSADDLYDIGDVMMVKEVEEGAWEYRQIPKVSGAFAAIDPRNGRVLSLVGGFSYETTNLNRATQALRQPGSAFKPFVYAAALDNGYLPNAVIVDAPIKINTPQGLWEPKNASGTYYGPTPMMTGLEQSRNIMTIRLAQDIGMDTVADYGERYGVYDNLSPVLANALGAQETTLYRLISAYSTFANGGKAITPSVVDRVQDRNGKTVFNHDARECVGCTGEFADPSQRPQVLSKQKQVMDPITAYQITTMLQSAVKSGTGKHTVGPLGLPIAGKTGTTNDARDVWFVGFTPNIVAGCYIGYDNPTPLGRGASGGGICGPVFAEFIQEALKTHGGFGYEVPANSYFVKLDRFSGNRLSDDASGDNVISMLFREMTVPDVGAGGIVIDGGLDVDQDYRRIVPGEDVPEDEVKSKSETETNIKVNGKTKTAPKDPSLGTISSGGLY